MFVFLVGAPGLGKSEAINNVRQLVRATFVPNVFKQACHLAPTDVTKGALLDYLSRPEITRTCPDPLAASFGKIEDQPYHSAFLAISELGNLIRENDTHLLPIFNQLFDCEPIVEEERRYRADKPIRLPRAQLTILGGTTPSQLGQAFPPNAWEQGFMARVILIYSSEKLKPNLFGEETVDLTLGQKLVQDLRQIGKMTGEFEFTLDCKDAIVAWQNGDEEPKPRHIRLQHYNTRRLRHALKLSMIAAADKGNLLMIGLEDFQQALAWMHEAEQHMENIFLEMSGKSEGQIMDDLYFRVLGLWTGPLHGKVPVSKGLLVNFLKDKVAPWQIDKYIEMSVEADLLIKCMMPGGELRYKPNEKAAIYRRHKKP